MLLSFTVQVLNVNNLSVGMILFDCFIKLEALFAYFLPFIYN